MKFIPVNGSIIKNEQAVRYGQAIYDLMEEHDGSATPEHVLSAARPKHSPLHDFFEWDNSEAAERYRLTQAGYLLRSIKIVVESPRGEVRAFHNVRVRMDGQGKRRVRMYADALTVFSDADYRAQTVAQALRELKAWESKYHRYSEFADVFAAIRKVEKKANGVKLNGRRKS